MARTRRTACKSTGRLPVGQLAPQNVPQHQESQPDIPQEASPKEEPFGIELVVPESPTAQDSPAEEQQPEDHGTEDKTYEEHPPPSDTEPEKMYRDADEVESFGAESPILASQQTSNFTGAPRHHHRSPVQGQGSPTFRASGVQGHRRDFLRIEDPLLTQGTSLQDFAQRCCCRCRLAGHHIMGP
jgi:hypothetical protein